MDPDSEDVPEWYPLIRAARYLRVAPWDLREQPIFWRERALAAEQAEQAHAEAMSRRHNRNRLGRKVH